MSSVAPSSSPAHPLPQSWTDLLIAVAQSLLQGRPLHALAWGYLVLVERDRAAYSALSQHDCACPVAEQQVMQDGLAALWPADPEHTTPQALADGLARTVGAWPLQLLRWLDGVALEPSPGQELSEDLFSPVQHLQLHGPTLRRLELPEAWQAVQVLRRQGPLRTAGVPSVQRQHVWPLLHMPHWCVLPVHLQRDQPSRQVRLQCAGGAFAQDCQRLAQAGCVRVLVAEVPAHCTPAFDSHWQAQGRKPLWQARGLHNEAEVQAHCLAHLAQAQAQGADVLVLPELLVTPAVRRALQDALYQHAIGPAAETGAHAVTAVVAGSFHVPQRAGEAEVWVNQASVLDRWGNEVGTEGRSDQAALAQGKFSSVDLVPVVEGNHKADTLWLAHSAIGVHAVGICLDLAQAADGDELPWKRLPVRWLWSPSLSAITSAHRDRAKTLGLHWRVSVACANQGAADFGAPLGGEPLRLQGEPGQSFVLDNPGGKVRFSPPEPTLSQPHAPWHVLNWVADEQF